MYRMPANSKAMNNLQAKYDKTNVEYILSYKNIPQKSNTLPIGGNHCIA